MLKSPSSQEKKSRPSLRKLMKRKLSLKTKDKAENEEFGGTIKWKFGKKNKLPSGIPREIVFSVGSDDFDDDFSTDSVGVPDLVSAETPIKTTIASPSESESYEKQTNVLAKSFSAPLQALPDRFQSLQNSLFSNRKSLIAVAAAALVCTQVPETTKLQLSVFAAGLGSTIMEQSKALITHNLPKTSQKKKPLFVSTWDGKMAENILLPDEKSSCVVSDDQNMAIEQDHGTIMEDYDMRPTDYIDESTLDQPDDEVSDQAQQIVPAESNQDTISSPLATLQENEGGNAVGHLDSEGYQGPIDMVATQLGDNMPERDGNVIVVQSNIMVQQGSGNTVIVQNNIVVPEGSKATIIIQSNIETPEDSQTVNVEELNKDSTYQIGQRLLGQLSAAMPWGTYKQLVGESDVTEIANGVVIPSDGSEDTAPVQIVPETLEPAADELPPECYNVFPTFLHKDCRGSQEEAESNPTRERNWIESLLTDAWVLNMGL